MFDHDCTFRPFERRSSKGSEDKEVAISSKAKSSSALSPLSQRAAAAGLSGQAAPPGFYGEPQGYLPQYGYPAPTLASATKADDDYERAVQKFLDETNRGRSDRGREDDRWRHRESRRHHDRHRRDRRSRDRDRRSRSRSRSRSERDQRSHSSRDRNRASPRDSNVDPHHVPSKQPTAPSPPPPPDPNGRLESLKEKSAIDRLGFSPNAKRVFDLHYADTSLSLSSLSESDEQKKEPRGSK